jgi:hypothetical protein
MMLLDKITQQVAVDGRVAGHEGRAKTGRESRLRLGDAFFGPRERLAGGVIHDRGGHNRLSRGFLFHN